MGSTQTEPALYDRLLEISSRHIFDDNDRSVIVQCALALMPADIRLIRDVAAYAGHAALVSDIVTALGLTHGQRVVVGKALAKLGYQRRMIRLDSTVYPLWLKDCELPKLALSDLLRRQEAPCSRSSSEVV